MPSVLAAVTRRWLGPWASVGARASFVRDPETPLSERETESPNLLLEQGRRGRREPDLN